MAESRGERGDRERELKAVLRSSIDSRLGYCLADRSEIRVQLRSSRRETDCNRRRQFLCFWKDLTATEDGRVVVTSSVLLMKTRSVSVDLGPFPDLKLGLVQKRIAEIPPAQSINQSIHHQIPFDHLFNI